jgi:hypothetical protein
MKNQIMKGIECAKFSLELLAAIGLVSLKPVINKVKEKYFVLRHLPSCYISKLENRKYKYMDIHERTDHEILEQRNAPIF